VLYYVPPETWGIAPWQVRTIARQASAIVPVFQSEAEKYRAARGNVHWLGHPIQDLLRKRPRTSLDRQRPTIGLFPGSRRMEVQQLLPVLRGAAALIHREMPDAKFLLSVANDSVARHIAPSLLNWPSPLETVHCRSHETLARCDFLLTCSGTATLEAAILDVPMVVMYRLPYMFDRLLQRSFLGSSGFALPNYITRQPIVPELGNSDANPHRLAQEALALLRDPQREHLQRAGLATVRAAVGGTGAVSRVADLVEELLDASRVAPPLAAEALGVAACV
jgi:lipid-A-disaccharide synthase